MRVHGNLHFLASWPDSEKDEQWSREPDEGEKSVWKRRIILIFADLRTSRHRQQVCPLITHDSTARLYYVHVCAAAYNADENRREKKHLDLTSQRFIIDP